jgi:hypothetical protein
MKGLTANQRRGTNCPLPKLTGALVRRGFSASLRPLLPYPTTGANEQESRCYSSGEKSLTTESLKRRATWRL